jgi:hypothetical protein
MYLVSDSGGGKARVQGVRCGTQHMAGAVFKVGRLAPGSNTLCLFHEKRFVEGEYSLNG